MRSLKVPAACLSTLLTVLSGRAVGEQAPPAVSANAIPSAQRMQPEELVQALRAEGRDKPLVLQVGPHVLYAEAHVPGSEHIGATSQKSGLDALRERVKAEPHDRFIVLYCGCCPWTKCPNVRPAYDELVSLGFQKVKVMYIADNFGANWVAKGYPVEKGR